MLLITISHGYCESMTVNAVVGFNGIVKLGTWNPVIVEIENSGQSGDFIVSVEVQRGTSYRTNRTLRFEDAFNLAGGDRKRFDFAVPIESSGLPVIVRVYRHDLLVVEQKYPVLGNVTRVPLIVALSRTAAFDFLIPEAMVTYPHPDLLPARWDAYFAADVVLLHDAELGRLSTVLIEALSAWVDAGGTLVIAGGAHMPRVPPSLADLVGFKIAGLRKVSVDQLSSAIVVDAPVDTGDVPISLYIGSSIPATVSVGDIPIVTRERRGAGVLITTAFDIGSYPFDTIQSRKAVWDAISVTLSVAELKTQAGRVFENPVASTALATADTGPSDRLIYLIYGTLVSMMMLALIAFVGNAPRSIGRWAITGTVIIIVTAGTHFGFNVLLFKPAYLDSVTSIAEYRPGASHALVTSDIIAVSTSRGEWPITVHSDPVVVLPRTRKSLTISRREGRSSFSTEHLLPWTHDAFNMVTVLPVTFETRLDVTDDTLHAHITNLTDYLMLSGLFLYRGTAYPAGPFAPGASLEHTFRRSTAPVASTLSSAFSENDAPESDIDPVKRALLVRLLSDEKWRKLQERDTILFVGWITDPPVHVMSDISFQHELNSQALIIILTPEEDAGLDADV